MSSNINTRWFWLAAFTFNIGSVSYAFCSNSMNNALTTMLLVFEIQDDQKDLIRGVLTGSYYIGALLGAMISSKIEKLNKGIVLCDICMVVGSGILGVANIYIFLFGRLLTGMGGGLQSVFLLTYMRQFSPTHMYAKMGGMIQAIFSVGYFLTMLFGLLFDNSQGVTIFWRIYFLVGGIPSLIRLILMISIYDFESPLYYLKHNDEESAKKILAKIYIQFTNDELDRIRDASIQKNVKFYAHPYRGQFIFGLFLVFIFQFCGFNAVVQYSTLIFEEAFSETAATGLSLTLSFLKVSLYSITGFYTIGRFGRRNPLLIGLLIMFLGNCGIAIASLMDLNVVMSFLVFLFALGNFSGTGPIIPIYLPEVTPGNSIPYIYWTFWGYSVIILLIFPTMKSVFGMSLCFAFFAGITAIGLVILYRFAIETNGKTNEQIDVIFQKKNNLLKIQDQSLLTEN